MEGIDNEKRILIITDSLGCPRNQIPPNQTWTEKIISKYNLLLPNNFENPHNT